jgi:hypothetical protein
LEAPPSLGPAAEDAQPGAGRVQEHPVEEGTGRGRNPTVGPVDGSERQTAAVGRDHLDGAQAEASTRVADPGGPAGAEVGGDDEALIRHRFGQGGGLAAGGGGQVEDPFARLGSDGGGDRLAGLVLRCRPALGHRRQAGQVADPPHEEGGRDERSRLDLHPVRAAEFGGEVSGGRAQGIGSQGHRGRFVGRGEDGVGVVAEVPAQEVDDPPGM